MSDENNQDRERRPPDEKGSLVWKLVFILAPWIIVGLLGAAWAYL